MSLLESLYLADDKDRAFVRGDPPGTNTLGTMESAIVQAKKDLNEDATVPKGMSGMKLAELSKRRRSASE